MVKTRTWPARAMYILIAAALVMSFVLTGAFTNKVSADPGLSEWDRVSTPTLEGFVLAPGSVIIDYALADGGEVAYAVVYAYDEDCVDDEFADDDYRLLKSDDHAATWTDITDALRDAFDLDEEDTTPMLLQVATDWEDPDFVAVALDIEDSSVHVVFSTDGGDTFEDIGEVEDGDVSLDSVSDLAVSYEAAGKREIAIGGVEYDTGTYAAGLFRSTVTGDSAAAWEDATAYAGWDDDGTLPYGPSMLVTDIIFSTSWALDKTILVTTVAVDTWYNGVASGTVHLQCGSWGTSEGWNEDSTLGIEAVPILEDEDIPMWLADMDARGIAGLTLPEDYNSKNTDDRVLWVWVNYYEDGYISGYPACAIMRVDDDSADLVGPMGQIEDGELWLTNVSYHGTIAEGEAIAGVLGDGTGGLAECCEGVQVYRNDGIRNMDICCERWHDACKPPTGVAAMAVSYVGDDKAYAVALQGEPWSDEGAWSVTFDDGDTWNQLSLIDTYIDYFSDVAVSPDCNKTMLVSVNGEGSWCSCDSVWLYADDLPEAEEYSGKWIRTWCGQLEGKDQWGLLRLAPEETTGDNVYLVDYYTNNVYWNDLEGLACWDPIGSTELDNIVDLAAQDVDTLFALDDNGDVAMFDDDEWHEDVDSEVAVGNTIAVWGDHILVGGDDGEVSYSDDGGETFDLLEEIPTIDGWVTVAFDTYFDTNDVVYAATDEDDYTGGIYSWVIGESEEWTDLEAAPLESQIGINDGDDEDETVEVAYTGLVVDRPGNPFTSADNGGVIYASYVGSWNGTDFTGVARSLEREVTVCMTCLTWDFLQEGLTVDVEMFYAYPDALKICGCLTPDSNTHLFAIDEWWDYDMCEGEEGAVWTFEDCYAKKAPEPMAPENGAVIPADPCSCYSIPFTITWDPLCDACYYEIEFALDEDFTMPVMVNGLLDPVAEVAGDTPSFSVMGGQAGGLSCEQTYYWRVRASEAATGQAIHSWWSDGYFSVAPSVEAGIITLVAPEPNAQDMPIKNVGFSWDLMADADAFDWVLDDNFDFSSPVESKDGLTSTAYECTKTLDYSTTYYWQVTAYNEGAEISMSAVGTFTTAATGEFCCPQCGLCFDTQAELEDHIADAHPAQPATPFWVWVIIGIGAVLVIVVIVLIFRTRRV